MRSVFLKHYLLIILLLLTGCLKKNNNGESYPGGAVSTRLPNAGSGGGVDDSSKKDTENDPLPQDLMSTVCYEENTDVPMAHIRYEQVESAIMLSLSDTLEVDPASSASRDTIVVANHSEYKRGYKSLGVSLIIQKQKSNFETPLGDTTRSWTGNLGTLSYQIADDLWGNKRVQCTSSGFAIDDN